MGMMPFRYGFYKNKYINYILMSLRKTKKSIKKIPTALMLERKKISDRLLIEEKNIVCHRCQLSKRDDINKKKSTCQCELCQKFFCDNCYYLHDKFTECFCEYRDKCYICANSPAFYDYGIKKAVCFGCI